MRTIMIILIVLVLLKNILYPLFIGFYNGYTLKNILIEYWFDIIIGTLSLIFFIILINGETK
jgi:hypothetical protein